MTAEQITVHEAIQRVVEGLGDFAPDGWNANQSFAFRSVNGTVAKLRPLLLENGLTYIPSYKSIDQSIFTSSGGSPTQRSVIEGTFEVVGPQGDSVYVTTIGEAVDTQGRASNQAMSAALKYFLIQLFQIANGEDGDAADSASHAPVSAPPRAAGVSPSPAAAAVAQRAAQVQGPPGQVSVAQDTGETISPGQKKNCWRLFCKLRDEGGWTIDDYKDQIEIAGGVRDDRQLTKSQAIELIKTLKDFAGEENEPLPEYRGE